MSTCTHGHWLRCKHDLFTKETRQSYFSMKKHCVLVTMFSLYWSDLWRPSSSEKSEKPTFEEKRLILTKNLLYYILNVYPSIKIELIRAKVAYKHDHNVCVWTHRLHKFKLLSLLHFLDLEDILQRCIIKNLPVLTHLWISLQQKQQQHIYSTLLLPNMCGRNLVCIFRN